MTLGMRVLRGRDWNQGEVDGGEGHLGIVVGVKAEEEAAEVVWDNGQVTTCRVGKEGKHDLRILDNAQAGVRFDRFRCDGCEKTIAGMRWGCAVCVNFDLCTVCYMLGAHDLSHEFERYVSTGVEGVRVGPRHGCPRLRVVGILPGARVSRGRDWQSGDVDGGAGGVGTVVEVVSPESGSARNAVRVSWDSSGQSVQHRLGLHGKVDLVLVKESRLKASVYLDHLPLMKVQKITRGCDGVKIGVGDSVRVEAGEEQFKTLQRGRGGWSVGLAKCVGKAGLVRGVSGRGDLEVVIGGLQWRIHPAALKKVEAVRVGVGDKVRILDDLEQVKTLQEGHGGWNNGMRHCLGKVGKVKRIDSDGDYRVSFGTAHWSFNPLCCLPDPHGEMEHPDVEAPDPFGELCQHLERLIGLGGGTGGGQAASARQQTEGALSQSAVKLGKAIVIGDVSKVAAILDREPGLIRQETKEGYPLHVAADNGEAGVASLLLDRGADINQGDRDEDTPLILAVNKNQRRVVELLLQRGADVSRTNRSGRTALHHAAARGRPDLCRLLLDHGQACLNSKDREEGHTPLFSCMETRDEAGAMEVLLACPSADVNVKNGMDFNALHYAAYRDRPRCAALLLAAAPGLAGEPASSELWTPLHVAAVNDRPHIIRLLLQGGADPNSASGDGFRPLHLACDEVHLDSATALVEGGADVNAQDAIGCAPLHRAVVSNPSCLRSEEDRLQVVRLLLRRGARTDLREAQHGVTALELASPSLRARVQDFLQQLEREGGSSPRSVSPRSPLPAGGPPKNSTAATTATTAPTATAATAPTAAAAAAAAAGQGGEKGPGDSGQEAGAGRQPQQQTVMAALPTCSTCTLQEADVIFLPCAHKLLCRGCAASVSACPRCGAPAKGKIDTKGNII